MLKLAVVRERRSNLTGIRGPATPIWVWQFYVQWAVGADRAPARLELALASARRALALDESDSRCHRILSYIYAHLRQFDRAEFHFRA